MYRFYYRVAYRQRIASDSVEALAPDALASAQLLICHEQRLRSWVARDRDAAVRMGVRGSSCCGVTKSSRHRDVEGAWLAGSASARRIASIHAGAGRARVACRTELPESRLRCDWSRWCLGAFWLLRGAGTSVGDRERAR